MHRACARVTVSHSPGLMRLCLELRFRRRRFPLWRPFRCRCVFGLIKTFFDTDDTLVGSALRCAHPCHVRDTPTQRGSRYAIRRAHAAHIRRGVSFVTHCRSRSLEKI
jgi:hypothetical protein